MANATPNRTAPGCWFLAIDVETLLRVSTLAETYTVWIKGDINWKMIVKNASQWEGFIMKTRQLGTHKINNGVLRTTDCKILSSNTRQINDNNYIHDISFACHFKHWRLGLCIKVGRGQGDGDIGTRVWGLGTWDARRGT